MKLLNKINKENDIKKISKNDLDKLAGEIREFLLENVSKTGGHLASNLGAVELTIALHRCLNLPEDKVIFDVGHQSYTHKILTGRKDEFYKLRQFGGISGFPKSSESECDAFNTGHSSTSISAALGMAKARELRGSNEKICAVIGDGSMTGGMVFEALDQMTSLNSNCLIILNDNEMSISKNVGGLSSSLSKFRVGKQYNELKSSVENALKDIPAVGKTMAKGIKKSKDSIKNLIVPGTIFGDMGITYVGPIDGHDIDAMTEIFESAFKLNRPVIVHIKTVKGKGYKFAERYPEHFHGVGPFDVETGKSLKIKEKPSYTDIFAKKLISLGGKNDKIVAITAAMAYGTGIRAFQKRFPHRTFDVGIAEQHAITFAAGLAKGGYIPVVAIYSSFLQRGYDQLLHDVALQNLHVIIMIDRSGIVGEDGETHSGIYDTAYLRSIPKLTVIAPKGAKELEAAMDYAVKADGPVCIKYPKGDAYTELDDKNVKFVEGKSEIINFSSQKGETKCKKVAIMAVGNMVRTAAEVRDRIKEETNYEPELINVRFINPIDKERIRETIKDFEVIAVMEEAVRRGSVGEVVGYEMAQLGAQSKLLHFCIEEETVQHGSVARVKESLGLDAEGIYNKMIKVVLNP
ncbi:MAG: 1-deoxy-D-xylulose-5-phosphate synthase [Eubacterium sp.]|nr:1-deoxy-D-xylulose-5-phosphate synthase [Eubacterium sp.]